MLATRPGEPLVGHSDWSAHNVRLSSREGGIPVVTAIYDGDSLRRDHEVVFVGNATVTACLDARTGRPFLPPTPAGIRAFVRAYENARAHPFERDEQAAIAVVAVRQLGYIARCQHALAITDEPVAPESMQRALVAIAG